MAKHLKLLWHQRKGEKTALYSLIFRWCQVYVTNQINLFQYCKFSPLLSLLQPKLIPLVAKLANLSTRTCVLLQNLWIKKIFFSSNPVHTSTLLMWICLFVHIYWIGENAKISVSLGVTEGQNESYPAHSALSAGRGRGESAPPDREKCCFSQRLWNYSFE